MTFLNMAKKKSKNKNKGQQQAKLSPESRMSPTTKACQHSFLRIFYAISVIDWY